MNKMFAIVAFSACFISSNVGAQTNELWGAIVINENFRGANEVFSHGAAWNYPSAKEAYERARNECGKREPSGYCDTESSNSRRVTQAIFSTSSREDWRDRWGGAFVNPTDIGDVGLVTLRMRCVFMYHEEEGSPPTLVFGDSGHEAEALFRSTYSRAAFYSRGLNGESKTYCNAR